MGSTIHPEPLRTAKEIFHRQRLVWRVNPECNFLLLWRSRFLVLGAEKRRFFGALKKKKVPKNIFGGLKIFWGGRKSYLAAEHHNEAAPKKKTKKNAWAPKKTTLGRLKEQRPRHFLSRSS